MRSFLRRDAMMLGLAALAGTWAGGAMAQPMMGGPGGGPGGGGPGGGGPGGGPGMMRGGPGRMHGGGGPMMGPRFADHAAYLAGVKAELGITEAQATAWKTYADAVAAAGAQMQALHQSMWEAMGTATWEERRDMMNRAFGVRQQVFDSMHDAALALLPALSERQKGKAEVILPGLARRGPGWRHHRG